MNVDEELLFFFALPLIAIASSFYAKSKIARRLLKVGGGYFLVTFSLAWALNQDCGYSDFHFGTCASLPQSIADFYDTPHLINIAAFVFLAPVLLVLAAFFEFLARRTEA
ncbi:MAG: hypothetical protein ACRBB0_11255 [Pelagimonas sp.]|uniref:hypothetical protein n=1 Tax=Pelagimonas sp. TaxID=2073170 RepID=UPI003D6A5BB7